MHITNCRRLFVAMILLAMAVPGLGAESTAPLVIAHRGASGYLPEHTLEAKSLAYGMRPDFIEQDLVLSRDGHLIVMHDIYLDQVTDVAKVFPDRARGDGHFYTIDFTLAELKQLQVTQVFEGPIGTATPKYPGRFPLWKSSFELSTFEEEIELIQGLNQSLGYDIGIYPEIKKPWFHHREGQDIAQKTLAALKRYGYSDRSSGVFLQSFDAEELQRIDRKLMPAMDMDLPLVQLVASTSWGEKRVQQAGHWVNYDYDWMLTPGGLEKIASYAEGIGPWAMMLVKTGTNGIADNGLTKSAQSQGLEVHPYTFRADSAQIPEAPGDFNGLLCFFVGQLRVDGLFTDHPDKVIDFLEKEADRCEGAPP
ncbi:glycerophosphoryl diester phosphodiesterase [Microbulbifer yueqingensis]|uniref:glycerophosphodiester phosphodiesterase n=2 Tax=Microbulbifer yueqingensis TaxID=658219 RepID=A0A1G8VZI8_9GAMM|nr:glycerophosphoryl diester phosphodiesterase [Microbulbifer yueqingensis]